MRVIRGSRKWHTLDFFIRQKHYLGKWPAVTPFVFALLKHESVMSEFVGVCCFSYPPIQTNERYGCRVLELSRLWVSDDMPKNTESWFISKCVGIIRSTDRSIGGIVSYADPSVGHSGLIYRACGFLADGMTDDKRKTPRCDYISNGIRYGRRTHIPKGQEFAKVSRISKHRYFLPLHRFIRNRIIKHQGEQ